MNKTNTSTNVKSNTSMNVKNNTKTNTTPSFNTKTNTTTTNTKNNNTSTSNNSSTKNNSTSGMSTASIIVLVIIILLLIGSMYWVYTVYTTKSFQSYLSADLMPDISDATITTNVPSSTIPSSNYSNEYAISFWMNIDDYNYNYGTEKTIISRGKIGNPIISLGDKHNDIIVRVNLQGPVSTSANSISKFEDIQIKIPNQNTGIGYLHPETVETKHDNIDIKTDTYFSDSLKKIGSNNIDYPTIQYTFDNNNPDDSNCGYFDLISGNMVNKTNTIKSNDNHLVEGFAGDDDAINAGVKVIVDICNIAKTIQSQQVADDSVKGIDNSFQSIIDTLEQIKKNSSSVEALNKAVSDAVTSMSENADIKKLGNANTALSQQFTTFITDLEALTNFNNVKVDYNAFVTAVNTKMTGINCPIVITGASDIDSSISLLANIINLIKKTLLTYVTNMNSGIAKIYPELAGTQGSGTCMTDLYSNKDPSVGMCVVKMVPLQKWVNVIVSVYNQIIDIYIDGQLSSSCVLKAFPNISNDDMNITPNGGFSGKMARVVFMNTAVTVKQARDIYYAGPVVTTSIFSMIPTWVYWTILIIIIIAIIYSIFM